MEGLSLTTVDEDGIRAQGTLACPLEPAKKPEQALATIRAQLARCGDSEFECAEVEVALEEVPFVPLSALNALRRDTLQQLTRATRGGTPHRARGARSATRSSSRSGGSRSRECPQPVGGSVLSPAWRDDDRARGGIGAGSARPAGDDDALLPQA